MERLKKLANQITGSGSIHYQRGEIHHIFTMLIDCMTLHFINEERMIHNKGTLSENDIQSHREEHIQLLKQVTDLKQQFKQHCDTKL